MFLKRISQSSLLRASGIYTLSSLINAAIPFILIPVLTRVFSTEDYGIVSMAAILINIVTPFIGVSAHGAIHRRYFEEGRFAEFPRYVGNSFILLLSSALLFFILFFIFGGVISEHTSVPKNWLYIILIISICQFVTLILLTIWQVMVKPLRFGILQITQTLINVGLSLFFIFELHYGWESRILGQLIAVSLAAIFSLGYLLRREYIVFIYNREDFRDILKFSLPLIPHTLGGLLITFTDRILITNMFSVEETGIFTVAFQIGSLLGIATASFNSAYIPWLYPKLNLDEMSIKKRIVKFTYLYFLFLIIVGVGLISFLPWFMSIFIGRSFQTATSYTYFIVLGYVFNGMYLMVTCFIFYAKKTNLLSFITIIVALLNIPLCYLFLKSTGVIGASISMCLIYFIQFIATWILSNKVYKMPWLNFKTILG